MTELVKAPVWAERQMLAFAEIGTVLRRTWPGCARVMAWAPSLMNATGSRSAWVTDARGSPIPES